VRQNEIATEKFKMYKPQNTDQTAEMIQGRVKCYVLKYKNLIHSYKE